MTVPGRPWEPMLVGLVDRLHARGDLTSAEWLAAFRAVPRHLFVPEILLGYAPPRALRGDNPVDRDEWLGRVYDDDSLVTQLTASDGVFRRPGGHALPVPTSSSTMPGLMARMLEVLDIRDGMRILEIGTGTGYNTALLCHRLGDRAVVSIDLDAGLVTSVRARLADLGFHPTLLVGDGVEGAPRHGPFDRIIATCAVPDVPDSWVSQLSPRGGMVLANLRGELAGGNLCLLTRHDVAVQAQGPVLPLGGHFMWLRPDQASPHRPHERRPRAADRGDRTTTTRTPTFDLDEPSLCWLLQLDGVHSLYRGMHPDPLDDEPREAVIAVAVDGSHAAVFTEPGPYGLHQVLQFGPGRVWDLIEAACDLFDRYGRPDPSRYGVTVGPGDHHVWLDGPDLHRWPLPLL